MPEQTKVLIVEDDKFLSELISTKLDKEGFSIALAGDGETGVKKASEFRPDIILLDIMLPGMDGFEVLEKLKNGADAALKAIPVIILSNFGQESKVERGLQLGAVDYLVKANFTTGEIVAKIKEVLK
ncbi:MAG: response regulator [Patescibacteria group bacterium]|jgi:DNA-binding response OmpR family regulator